MNSSNLIKLVKCPHCAKSFNYKDKATRPFCSERCKMIDLGSWLGEGYNIPVDESNLSSEELEKVIDLKTGGEDDSLF